MPVYRVNSKAFIIHISDGSELDFVNKIRKYKVLRYNTIIPSIMLLAFLVSCATSFRKAALTVEMGLPVCHTSDHGDRFVARYGSLSDGSLHFVKVKMTDGQEYTLPQVISASGVRYTDERSIVWWTHQRTVRVDVRDAEGNWTTKYPELHEVPEKK
jgi:hypothetical protein